MKSLKFPLIFFACLMIWNLSVGQSIILKTDTVPFGLDSTAVVKLPEYRGVVNWQVSYDKTNWHDILQSDRDSIIIDRDVDAWYRAEVSDGTCNKVYSDTVIVQNSDTFEITPYVPIQDIHGVVEGEQVSVIYNNDTIVCVKDSNEYIFQGDIVFTEDELIFLNDLKGASLPVWSFTERLWPEGKVYYDIVPSWDPLLAIKVNRALAHWEENTLLEFIHIRDAPDQPNFIEFINDNNVSNSRLGMVGGRQLIRICIWHDHLAVRHEIGHAIGLHHEHSRADRDEYIIVNKDNLKDPEGIDYALFKNSFCFGDFDYISLMLYPSKGGTAAIDNNKPILQRLDGGIWHDDLVQRELSPGDIAMVNYLYSRPPSVKTAGVTDFNGTNATCGGTVYNDGGSPVIGRGICWNTTGNPKVGSQNTTHDGYGTGSFSSMITNLEPNMSYYVSAYAMNSQGIGYGNQIIFENDPSVTLPAVYTKPIDVRIYYSPEGTRDIIAAYVHGQVLDDGGAAVIERGACWNISGNATTADETQLASQGGMGSYDVNLGLSYGVQYCLRAYANNKKGTSYGNEIVFTVNEFEEDFPSIRTNEVAAVTGNSAKCGGIISTGTVSAFSSRGVFYSTHNNPTVIDQVADIGPGGNGSFELNLTGLESEKLYYARAFAVTDRGTLYGSVVSFTTAGEENQTGTFIDPRDNHVYKWVQIGEQTWMAENLAWLPSVNPSSIGSEEQPYFYVYDYNGTDPSIAKASSKYTACGVLYNWPAAVNACPAGWHLPGDEEWKQLEIYLGMNQIEVGNTGIRGTDQGSQMKTTSGWLSEGNGTNSSGFSGFPSGYRDFDGPFESNPGTALWWSSTEFSEGFSWYRCLNFDFTGVDRNGFYKSAGASLRCVKDITPISLANLVTISITDITQNGAIGGGEVISDGGTIVTVRGICWNTTGNPTTNDNKTSDGQGIGSFTSILDDLTASTTYYVRAYATNSQGTAYGNEVTFTTDNITTSGTFVDPRDNHVYKWVQIGEQTWMAENLAFDAGAGSWAFNNEESNVALYGRIYDWTTSLSACPSGWHLPSFEEWNILAAYISSDKGPYVNDGDQWEFVGGHLKSTTGWKNNGNGTDDYGFNGTPVMGIGFFEGEYAGWWSSDETTVGGASAFHRFLYFEHGSFRFTNHPKEFGYSVRCIKD